MFEEPRSCHSLTDCCLYQVRLQPGVPAGLPAAGRGLRVPQQTSGPRLLGVSARGVRVGARVRAAAAGVRAALPAVLPAGAAAVRAPLLPRPLLQLPPLRRRGRHLHLQDQKQQQPC